MYKVLKKVIMKRSQLRNVFLKKEHVKVTLLINCTGLLRKEKRSYFENIDSSKISGNRMFWKIVKLMFSSKCVNRERES